MRKSLGGTTIQPTRQPVMLKYLEKLLITQASWLISKALTARSPKCSP